MGGGNYCFVTALEGASKTSLMPRVWMLRWSIFGVKTPLPQSESSWISHAGWSSMGASGMAMSGGSLSFSKTSNSSWLNNNVLVRKYVLCVDQMTKLIINCLHFASMSYVKIQPIERCLRDLLPWTPESQYVVPGADTLHACEGTRPVVPKIGCFSQSLKIAT